MAHPLIGNLEHMAGLMHDVDRLKDMIGKLPGTNERMVKLKANMRNGLNEVFGDLVHFQQELTNTYTSTRPEKEDA